jgi:hypothetical protein
LQTAPSLGEPFFWSPLRHPKNYPFIAFIPYTKPRISAKDAWILLPEVSALLPMTMHVDGFLDNAALVLMLILVKTANIL